MLTRPPHSKVWRVQRTHASEASPATLFLENDFSTLVRKPRSAVFIRDFIGLHGGWERLEPQPSWVVRLELKHFGIGEAFQVPGSVGGGTVSKSNSQQESRVIIHLYYRHSLTSVHRWLMSCWLTISHNFNIYTVYIHMYIYVLYYHIIIIFLCL